LHLFICNEQILKVPFGGSTEERNQEIRFGIATARVNILKDIFK
jgi:hypothetical protein